MTRLIYEKPVLIFGCGNTLFGNDGFGPEVIRYLNNNFSFPESVLVLDAGTGIRDFIFDLILVEKKPELILIIDAVTMEGRTQGEVFTIEPGLVPREKMADFSLHQSPSSNLISQLVEQGVEVKVIAMHTESVPNEICPGLCPRAEQAVEQAADIVIQELKSRDAFNQ
ncbi:hydrogenase maturation protease [Desulfospira joergensenii]|uniref:hydrogenase maturation protease n=1 Tax=Desulfospira joergensenii TaxID=53329 RepID=UPI000429099F|nr:hydrogenase maturation protease [Desulfospira joergensenii]